MDFQKAVDEALPKLHPHLPTFLASFAFFNIVHLVLVPLLARHFFSSQWKAIGARSRNSWAVHICSQIHADADRAFGWHTRSGTVQAVACGYFLWDLIDAIINFVDIGFVLHGVACLAIYLLSFKPFLAYYASRCLLWEASTFFLNIHWMLDKTGRTGSRFQLINGLLLLVTFFSVRLVYGGLVSYNFFQTLWDGRDQIPLTGTLVTGGGNVLLQALNWFWFAKMVGALRKRFTGASPKKAANGNVNGNANRTKSD
ncbi:DUF887-domain-containing protein [Mycena rebaudengoi]|nr:DUF887-domain-containing protein [Mycena rebaudengoi]